MSLFEDVLMAAREEAATKCTGYVLGDAEAIAKMHPETFEIPELHEREDVLPSVHVKLMFLPVPGMVKGPSAERMWVRVSRRVEKGGKVMYAGTLGNDPAVFPAHILKHGVRVDFGPEHILSIREF